MKEILYTGLNYPQVKELAGDRVMAPYFCMGFSMLSLITDEGCININEGDTLVFEDDGSITVKSQR